MARDMDIRAAGMIEGWKNGTNINTLDVPPEMRVRVSTGLRHFDVALGGEGATPSQCVLFTSLPGLGKTTTCLQLADALTGAGHTCLYNSCEENLYQVKMTVERLRLQHGFVAGQDQMLADVIKHGKHLIKKHPGRRLVLIQDSLQSLDDGFYKDGGVNSMTTVRCTNELIKFAKETFSVVIIVGQATKNGEFAGKNTIAHAVDTKLRLRLEKDKDSDFFGCRVLYAEKNRMGMAGIDVPLHMTRSGLQVHKSFDYDSLFSVDDESAGDGEDDVEADAAQ